MRLSLLAVSAFGLVFSWGCKPPPKEITEARFRTEVRRYFENLNVENESRRMSLRSEMQRAEDSPVFAPPTGVMYHTYVFDDTAFIVTNFKCRACGVKLMVLIPALEYLCPSCGHCPYLSHGKGADLAKSPCTQCVGADHKVRPPDDQSIRRERFEDLVDSGVVVKDMFELGEEDPEKPMEAVIRYVRRQWVWDPRGVVQVSQKAVEKAASDPGWIISSDGTENRQRPGLHRLDASYLGEIRFRLQGDVLVKVSESPEEPVRQWKDLTTIK